ncbi:MAG: DUF3244 domain-containing protein [Bacteroidales bacterium]|nr:DUF3244 domain-containing protein [Bacteroidales bacterium]
MKTLVLTTALVVLTTFTYSQVQKGTRQKVTDPKTENVKCKLVKKSQDQLTLVITKVTDQKVTVKLKKENGMLVHQKNLKKAENNRITYDISALPEGKYRFEVTSGKEVLYTQKFKKGQDILALTD